MRTLHILLPRPFDHGFDYRVPRGMALAPGDYVWVPFGSKTVAGVVWGKAEGGAEEKKIREVSARIDHIPPMSASMRRFIDWVAHYTMSPRGAVLKMALSVPDALKVNPRERGTAGGAEQHDAAACSPPSPPSLSSAQKEATEVLSEKLSSGFSVTLLDGVTGSGKTEVYFDAIEKLLTPSTTQPLNHSTIFPQTLVLLPEIALSVQWLERFERRFGFSPHLWHSEVPKARKRDTWRAVARGKAQVVVGARSALFLPFAHLALIVVDEEHDASYKQEDGVIYQARDMAVARAKEENIPALLVSATPSLETVYNVEHGRYRLAHLPERHGEAALPEIELVDMRPFKLRADKWLSPLLEASLRETLAAGHQAMLFLNRRGYAPLLLCRACGHRFQCPHCTAWLVQHRKRSARESGIRNQELAVTKKQGQACLAEAQRRRKAEPALSASVSEQPMRNAGAFRGANKAILQCHHCGYSTSLPETCPECGAEDKLAACGPGVERVAEEVAAALPEARIEVMASDRITTAKEAGALVQAMQAGEIDLLIGTQMIAKGHHFPGLALVGVVDGDLGLAGGDLRAGERTYQLLHQVAGRAGREAVRGRALVQTYLPEHPVMQALAEGDRDRFLRLEAEQRAYAHLPPYGRLAALIVEGRNEQEVQRVAQALARRAPHHPDLTVLGPVPAPLAVLRGNHRRRLLVKAPRQMNLQRLLRDWLATISTPRQVRLKVDIDPYSFL